MTAELRKKDSIPPPAGVRSWLGRARELFYCDMDGLKDRRCHCTGWDYNHPLYRFYLCPRCKPKWHLVFKELFDCERGKNSREDTWRLQKARGEP